MLSVSGMEVAIVNFGDLRIGSPKRNKRLQTGWEGFFPYYAGYPEAFAADLLSSAKLKPDAVVLDPWNGSGTTTYVASRLGYEARGLDINPVMVVVARARMLPPSEADALLPLAGSLISRLPSRGGMSASDPLGEWFSSATAGTIRSLERAIRASTVGDLTVTSEGTDLGRISGLAATLYVALFSVCRTLTVKFRPTNPTWIRPPKLESDKVAATKSEVLQLFLENIRRMAAELVAFLPHVLALTPTWRIDVGDTTNMDLDANSVDCVLTSPPYCTRIDYTSATRIELAVLAPLVGDGREELSLDMIGSVRVPSRQIEPSEAWGPTCIRLLDAIQRHPSKASSTYYYKTHLDYFDKMSKSLNNVSRCLKPGASAFLVVQDSYYKDIHNDLATIISEMAEGLGLLLARRDDFEWRQSMARINRHTQVYKRSAAATESVLSFKKAA